MLARRQVAASSRGLLRRFSTAEAGGVSVAVKDDPRPVSQLSLVVKAGSRYEPGPGVAHVLEKFAFRNTERRSALRLVRESELLGGQLSAQLGRENLVLTAKFLREDLPYFVEALGDVAESTLFKPYELVEDVVPLAKLESSIFGSKALNTATEAAHAVAFRKGLGNSVISHLDLTPVSLDAVKTYAREAYTKANISILASGVVPEDLQGLVERKFKSLASGSALQAPAAQFYSGESRIPRPVAADNAIVIGFAVKPSPINSIIANVLGSQNPVKWSVGQTPLKAAALKTGASISANVHKYSDADFITVSVSAEDAATARAGTLEAVRGIKEVANSIPADAITRAVAQATFSHASQSETDLITALTTKSADYASINAQTVQKAVGDLIKGKVALSVVGQVHELPYLDELF